MPGAVVTTVGLILSYAQVTGNWHAWAYAWTLIPAAVGLGVLLAGGRRAGGRILTASVIMFAVAGLSFEGLICSGKIHMMWPVLLIVAGGLVLAFGART